MEENLPCIRRKLKKTSHRVEKYPKIPWYLFWYYTIANNIFKSSFEELEGKINELRSEDKLSSLLQGFEVIFKCITSVTLGWGLLVPLNFSDFSKLLQIH